MREVIEKQETLQRKFVEVLDKCEKDRMAREEAWKKEELERIKKERELLAQERSIAAAKDEVVLAFLRKFAGCERGKTGKEGRRKRTLVAEAKVGFFLLVFLLLCGNGIGFVRGRRPTEPTFLFCTFLLALPHATHKSQLRVP